MFARRILIAFMLPAVSFANQARQSAESAEQLLSEADRLSWIGNWIRAEPVYAKAERLFKLRQDRRNAMYAHVSRLRAQMGPVTTDAISAEIARTLEDPTVQHDPSLRLRCLVVKGDADMEINSNDAERDWNEALSLARALKEDDWASRASGELGVLAFLHGDSATAMIKVGGALKHAEQAHDIGAQIRYLTLMANGLAEFGETDQALKMFDKAIAVAGSQRELGMPMMALTGKATTLVAMNRATEADELLEQALSLARSHGNLGYQAELQMELGKLAAKTGHRQKAIFHLKEAAQLATKTKGLRLLAQTDYELAALYNEQHDDHRAARALQQGIFASRQTGDRYYLPRYLGRYAAFEAAHGRVSHSEALFDEATDIVNGMLANVSSSSAESDLVSAMNDIYLGHFRVEAERGNTEKAFQIVEQARARALSDFLRRRPYLKATNEVPEAEKRISELQIQLWKNQSSSDRKRLLDEIFDAERQFGPEQARTYQRWMQVQAHQPSMQRVLSAIRGDEAIVEFVTATPASYAFVVTHQKLTLHRLAPRTEIDEAAKNHLDVINARRSTQETGKRLYSLLLKPLNSRIESPRLIVVRDGTLYQIPFESLIDETGQMLLEGKIITYAPSLYVLALLREQERRRDEGGLLFAVSSSSKSIGAQQPEMPASSATFREASVFNRTGINLSSLTAANDEVQDIATVFGAASSILLDADEATFKKANLSKFQMIHLAVHGLVDTKDPGRSMLIFRPDPASGEDGFLQAREIALLPLRADLVTLAACETAAGRVNGEEGIASLVRPFLIAGARSVLANLWETDDQFSRGLMVEFYSRLAKREDQATALTEAKRSMIQKFGDQAPPYLWAGFVIEGDANEPIGTRR